MTRVVLPVATTVVEQKTRSAFSSACVADALEQLNARAYPVTYEYRRTSVCGTTVIGTARMDGRDLMVELELQPPWWTPVELEAQLAEHRLGGGIAGRILKCSNLDTIEVIERIRVGEVTLLQLHASVNPAKPARKAP